MILLPINIELIWSVFKTWYKKRKKKYLCTKCSHTPCDKLYKPWPLSDYVTTHSFISFYYNLRLSSTWHSKKICVCFREMHWSYWCRNCIICFYDGWSSAFTEIIYLSSSLVRGRLRCFQSVGWPNGISLFGFVLWSKEAVIAQARNLLPFYVWEKSYHLLVIQT